MTEENHDISSHPASTENTPQPTLSAKRMVQIAARISPATPEEMLIIQANPAIKKMMEEMVCSFSTDGLWSEEENKSSTSPERTR